MAFERAFSRLQTQVTPGRAMRVLADALLIALALGVAMIARLLFLLAFELPAGDDASFYIQMYARNYVRAVGPLVLVSLVTFWLHGFYSYGHHYRGKYKLLVVLRAVLISFLAFGFFEYFVSQGNLPVARGALPLAWALATVLLVGARAWSDTWQRVAVPEAKRVAQHKTNRVLVIGGGGYIGSALLPILLNRGYEVRLLDLLMFGEEPIREVIDHPKLEVIEGDFRNVVTVFRAMQDVSAVVHLGGIVGDPACSLDEELTIDVNLISTHVVAELAQAAGVRRFVFASSCSVYGASDDWLEESSQAQPISLYGRTKLASEQVLLSMAAADFSPVLLRFATIYGLSGRTRFDLVVNLLTAKAKVDQEITLHGGDQWRPFIHVQDAARSVATVLDAPERVVKSQIYNVGSNDQNYTIRQIAELIQERVVGSRLVTLDDAADHRNYRVRFDKIQRDIGFEATWTVPQGIQQVLESIATGEVVDYKDSRFSNAKFLTEAGMGQLARDQWARDLIEDMSK